MSACDCDFDFRWTEYPDGEYIRTNPSTLCPIHDQCDWCDKRLAVEIAEGDKLCKECLKELAEERRQDELLVRSLRSRG